MAHRRTRTNKTLDLTQPSKAQAIAHNRAMIDEARKRFYLKLFWVEPRKPAYRIMKKSESGPDIELEVASPADVAEKFRDYCKAELVMLLQEKGIRV